MNEVYCENDLCSLKDLIRRKYNTVDPKSEYDAAVLIPLCWRQGKIQVLLTLRSSQMPTHPGEVSFPGGKKSTSDDNDVSTALRETLEEIYPLESEKDSDRLMKQIEVLGRMEIRLSKHGLRVSPIIAFLNNLPEDVHFPSKITDVYSERLPEVTAIFYVNLNLFSKPHLTRVIAGGTFQIYDFMIDGARIWGLTAFLLMHICNNIYGINKPQL